MTNYYFSFHMYMLSIIIDGLDTPIINTESAL